MTQCGKCGRMRPRATSLIKKERLQTREREGGVLPKVVFTGVSGNMRHIPLSCVNTGATPAHFMCHLVPDMRVNSKAVSFIFSPRPPGVQTAPSALMTTRLFSKNNQP